MYYISIDCLWASQHQVANAEPAHGRYGQEVARVRADRRLAVPVLGRGSKTRNDQQEACPAGRPRGRGDQQAVTDGDQGLPSATSARTL